MKILLHLTLSLFFAFQLNAQSIQYRTIHSGKWTDSSVWQLYNGTQWIPAGNFPTGPNQQVRISKGDTLQIDAVVVIDSLNLDRKSTRLNSSHIPLSRMPSSA